MNNSAYVVVETLYAFDPKPDITAYELAVIVKNVSAHPLSSLEIRATLDRPIPEHLVRHFRKKGEDLK
jgi:hypothetical protein